MRNKKIMVQPILGLVLILSLTMFSYPLLVHNWRECASAPGCTCTLTLDIKKSMAPTLKTYIVESAGFFLKSHASYQDFLNLVEMTDLNGADYSKMRSYLYNAVDYMENAYTIYTNLKLASEKIPYDPVMLDRLLKFDYAGFQAKSGLLAPVFEKVKSLLAKGDIAGFDDEVLNNMDTILNQLYEVRDLVDKEQSPDIALLWQLTQSYFETQLFGQYASAVFKANIY